MPAGPRKSDYLYTNFLPNFPPISIPFSKEKHPILIKLGIFYNNLPKIHPIYVIWAPSSLMKTPRSLYQISRKSAPKGRHIYVYHVNVRTPPPDFDVNVIIESMFCMFRNFRTWMHFFQNAGNLTMTFCFECRNIMQIFFGHIFQVIFYRLLIMYKYNELVMHTCFDLNMSNSTSKFSFSYLLKIS